MSFHPNPIEALGLHGSVSPSDLRPQTILYRSRERFSDRCEELLVLTREGNLVAEWLFWGDELVGLNLFVGHVDVEELVIERRNVQAIAALAAQKGGQA